MLNVESIQNGVVIDHIPAGKGMDIYRLLWNWNPRRSP